MELRDYARAIVSRWAWVLVGGSVGMILAVAVGVLPPAAYRSDVTLYVDAALLAGPQDPSSAAEVRTTVLPSVARLARSEAVLAEVADALGTADPPDALAADVDVVTETDTNVLHITATRSTPAEAVAFARAVGTEVRARAAELYPGPDGPLLQVTPVRSSAEPTSTAPSAAVLAALGAVAGAGAAGVLAGLVELGRPRVRGRREVAAVSSAPVLALLPVALPVRRRLRVAAGPAERAEVVARLRSGLEPASGDVRDRRLVLVGAAAGISSLADELSTRGLAVTAVDDPRSLAAAGGIDGVVVVADGRRTTPGDLEAALAAVRMAGAPLIGVVVDGLLPSGAGWRERLRAACHGDPLWSVESRRGPEPTEAGGAAPVATRMTAVLAVAAVGFTHPLPMTLSGGLLAAAALLPLWLPLVRQYHGLRLLLLLTGAGLFSGALLAWTFADDHDFAPHEAGVRVSLVLGAVCGVGVLLWARRFLSVTAIGTCFGLSMLATQFLEMSGVDNVWKFQLSSPLMVIGLSLAARRGRPVLTLAALAVLAVLNVTNDARSAFGFCALACCLVLWQLRPRGDRGPRRTRLLLAVPVLGAGAALAYWLLTQLILAGALGSGLQARTATQIDQTGSLILGGRPEWTATWALMRIHPLGFGLGIVPNGEDVLVGKAGIEVTNIPTADHYLLHYLLNGGVQLHSIVADLWSSLGPAGLVLGLVMGGLVVIGFVERFGRRQASGLVCLLVPMTLWTLPFGPLASNVDTLALALGLLLAHGSRPPRSEGLAGVAATAPAAVEPPRRSPVPTA